MRIFGHDVGSGKTSTTDVKTKVIQKVTKLSIKTQVRSILGIVGYYSRYIKHYAVISVPLTNALKRNVNNKMLEWRIQCNVLYASDIETDLLFKPAKVYMLLVYSCHRFEMEKTLYLRKKFYGSNRTYSTIKPELECG